MDKGFEYSFCIVTIFLCGGLCLFTLIKFIRYLFVLEHKVSVFFEYGIFEPFDGGKSLIEAPIMRPAKSEDCQENDIGGVGDNWVLLKDGKKVIHSNSIDEIESFLRGK